MATISHAYRDCNAPANRHGTGQSDYDLLITPPVPAARGDRRAKVLKLTPDGRRVVETALSRHAAELEAAMVVLNASEKRQLHGMLKKLGALYGRSKRGN